MAKKTAAMRIDLSNVSEGGGQFRKTRQEAGDYRAKIMGVELVSKKDDKKVKQWVWTIKAGSGVYPYYTGFQENVLWKIRNLFAAAGVNLPKKIVQVDPNKIVGKSIGVTLEDDEYDGKKQSSIAATFPTSELEGEEDEDDDDDEGVDDEDDEEEVDDEDEDEDEEDSDDDEEEDEDDEDEEEEPEPPKKKAKAKAKKGKKSKKTDDVDDDELEELEIEDI